VTDAIEDARDRNAAAGRKLDRYLLVWMTLFIVFVWLRGEHFIHTPWAIVFAPLWFGPALFIAVRLAKFVTFVSMTILWLIFNFEKLAGRR
jgi:hypothetical protein